MHNSTDYTHRVQTRTIRKQLSKYSFHLNYFYQVDSFGVITCSQNIQLTANITYTTPNQKDHCENGKKSNLVAEFCAIFVWQNVNIWQQRTGSQNSSVSVTEVDKTKAQIGTV